MPLGMEDQRILSGHLRASSSYNYNHGPDRARLNIYAGHGRTGAWVARYRNTKQWLQVDLRQMSIIKGIATQGRREAHQWVRSYHLSYSRFGSRFRAYVAYGRVKVFRGNYDIYHTVGHKILPAIKAQFIRIHPRSWYSYIAIRVELYGCRARERFYNRPIGLQNYRIKNAAITASSQWDQNHAPWLARLHRSRRGRFIGAWSSRRNDYKQWLQVDMGRSMKVTGIATQGRQDADQWVTAYYVYISSDGVTFAKVKHWWNYVKTFQGNRDRMSVQTHSIDPPIYGRYVRIIPRGWRSHISMRLELYGGPWNRCDMPLGLEDGRVPDPLIRASSFYNYYCGPFNARLNRRRFGRQGGAWCAKGRDRRQWLQVDFGALSTVSAVATQGRQNSAQWVTSYYISYSRNGYKFAPYREGRRTRIFQGNYDRFIIVRHRLKKRITARFFRIHPVTWYSWISMRVEFYGCVVGPRCNKPLGLQNGRIRSSQLTASSSWDRNHGPNNGRLYFHQRGKSGAWCARHNNRLQWYQVNFGRATRVVKVATQGRKDYRQWVTQYYLSFSQDGIHFADYKQNSNRKYFTGNRDQNSVVQHGLYPRIKAYIIRVHPWGWYRHISMRVEFYGCREDRCVMPLGLEDKRVPNGHLTASSYYNYRLSPWYGRLNSIYSWSVRRNRVGQWFQVNFVELMRIKGVATQGRQNANQWVRSYTVRYSVDGMSFRPYRENRRAKIFIGNTDRHSVVYHQFVRPFKAIYVRIYPRSWYGWISMRAELYGCSASLCNRPLGMRNGRIRNHKITASSSYNRFHAAWLGRLGRVKTGRYIGAWCAKHKNYNQWFKVDFGRPMKITKIATQGRQDVGHWITSYYVSFSADNIHWAMYRFRSVNKLFQANRDQNSIKMNAINPAIRARFIRLHPRGWHGYPCLRAEFYGCAVDRCDVPLGIQDGRITRSMFSASSMYNHYYGPWCARLQAQNRGQIRGGWIAKYRNTKQWLQVDLGTVSIVKRIATQARYDANQWVTSYTVSYSNNGVRFFPYKQARRTRLFQGNSERYFVVVHRLRPAVRGRYIRINPKSWYGWIAMRLELFGCRLGKLCNRPMGLQNNRLKNHFMTSSSRWDKYHGPYQARLNIRRHGRYIGAWSSQYNNRYQWLQVDFAGPAKIIRICTQGRQDLNQWVTQYYVTRSLDAVNYRPYKERNNIKYFSGNRDQNTVVCHPFIPALRCRYVRVHPWGWYRHISMRAEFYGCRTDKCTMPLGIEDRRILSGHLRASSSYNYNHGPDRARLNIYASHGRTGAWVAKYRNTKQWLQVDLRQLSIIKGIATQGRREAHQYVSRYTLSYSVKGLRFRPYVAYGRIKVFRGNYDIYHTVSLKIIPPIRARFLRIHPKSWRSYIAMRVELYGCRYRERFFDQAVGIQTGKIKNAAFTASSQWDKFHAPFRARLHIRKQGRYIGAWASRPNNHNQWLMVDLGIPTEVTGIATQGRQDAAQWVTAFWVYYSLDGMHFSRVTYWWDYIRVSTFRGNVDQNGLRTHSFNPPLYARLIKINPRGWRSHISMRLELYGGAYSKCDVPIGLEDRRVPDQLITASSFYNYYCAPRNARLRQRRVGRLGGAWCAKRSDRRQWLKIDLGGLTRVSRIASQGRQNSDQWVTSYYVSYSTKGYRFITYKENRRTKIFQGNFDRYIVVQHRFIRPLTGRCFKVHPVTWRSWISMRVELYGCVIGPRCDRPLGMKNGRIRSNQITASSSWDRNHGPGNARLHWRKSRARVGAWSTRHNNHYQFLQVYFKRPTRVVKIATQGRQDARQWVTKYFVAYSQDGANFAEYKENSNRKYITGNRDQNTVVQYRFFPPIKARFIQIRPWGWYRHISMRVEFYGCAEDRCNMPLGLEDKRLTPGDISASSYYNAYLAPWYGRLNHIYSWSVRTRNSKQWMKVNFGDVMRFKGIATQGRSNANQWVMSYVVTYSGDDVTYVPYKERRRVKIFSGNSDRNSVVYHRFLRSFSAAYVKIHPRTWYGWISMRVELYGCARPLCNTALGLQSGRLRNNKISASSEYNVYHGARLGRLGRKKRGRYVGAWCTRANNRNQWLKVDFSRPMKITKILTQGRQDAAQWVTYYKVSSSLDGVHWQVYRFKNSDKIFRGNNDQNSIKIQALTPPVYGRFIRIHPWSWYRHISMRVEFYGCKTDPCDIPLGMQDGRITPSMLTASSMYNHYYGPWNARLHARNYGSTRGGWIAKYRNRNQWLQIDFGTKSRVKRICTQGRYDANQFVKSYTVSFSVKGDKFVPYKEGRRTRLFQANIERYYVVCHRFFRPFIARYVRINVRSWYSYISMRVELFGCRLGKQCNQPMGLQNGRLRNTQMTGSSQWNKYHAPFLGRLHRTRHGKYVGAWCARSNNRYQYLQVDFKRPVKIIKLSTQGRQDVSQWVTQYYIKHSVNAINFVEYKERNSRKYFTGNRDRNTVVTNPFNPAIRGRYIRVCPWGWYRHISMRVEFYGCFTDRCSLPLGMEDRRILSGNLRASSSYNYNHGPDRARLNIYASHGRTGAWVAKYRNTKQWLQIDLGQMCIVKGIATQGRRKGHLEWVKSYVLSYSKDGLRFRAYSVGGRLKVFRGNYDVYHTVAQRISPNLRARYVRIHPKTWRSRIAMRIELYGCRYKERLCDRALGMQSGRIRNRAIKASSQWDNNHAAYLGRLKRLRRGKLMGAWSARHNNYNQWIQVDLRKSMKVTGVATQGREETSQWVTAFYVLYSSDGVKFAKVKDWWDVTKTFPANVDRYSVRNNPLPYPIYGRFVRLQVRGWRSHISMRLELYGCPWSRYDVPLGIEDGRFPDQLITASSFYNYYCAPRNARLRQRRVGRYGGAWCARRSVRNTWLQFDFGGRTRVTRVCTQGRQNADQWVTSYYVKYSKSGQRFIPYREGRRTKIFAGNYDRYIVVCNRFIRPISGRYFRIYPTTWRSWISMRVEFYGCATGPRCNKPLGMQSGRIRHTQLSASSSWDVNHGPRNGRLHFRRTGSRMGAWCARHNNRYQWYQVDFGRAMRIVKIATMGRQDYAQWVTQYFVTYSQDGASFAEYKENSNRKYFSGNRDQNSVVQYRLFPPIRARFIRVHPWGWYKHISMRMEFYGCPEDPCNVPLGIEDKRITNGQLSASSYYNHYLAPWHGRLNHRWSWSVRHRNNRQWLQVNFQEIYRFRGIATQGRQDANQWVKSYALSYGLNGVDFAPYKERGRVKLFTANTDRHSVVYHRFIRRVAAVFVRVHPKTWYGWISMRIEFFGCSAALCNRALGMRSGAIKNAQITASSAYNKFHAASLGRLGRTKRGRYIGAWCARHNNHNQWFKVDFGLPMKITKIDTQGRQDYGQWVTRYLLSSSQDGIHWSMYRYKSNDQYFPANRDQHSKVSNVINPPIIARFVRIIPRGWYRHICMRVEFYGCKADKCDVPLGIQDGRITQSMLTASSMYNRYYGPWSARLQARNHGAMRGGWLARVNNNRQWLQIDLGAKSVVKRIATQGRYDANQWVTSYTVSYSNNGVRFYPYRENRRIFPANQERYFVVFHRFFKPFAARFVRVKVRSWYGHIALRVELYGCSLGRQCNQPMGLQSGRLKNHLVTASSQWDKYHAAFLARLHWQRRGRYMGAWSARHNNRYQWLQLDFGRWAKIIRLATQGRQDTDQWVTQYYVKHSLDGMRFVDYQERNTRKYFTGNRDRNTVVMYPFNPPIRCRFLRIVPWGWRSHISMRVEAYGCYTDRCTMPLGMEDRRILSGHLRASSSYNYNHGPDRARLNIYAGHGRTGAWVARYRNTKQWLQVDLRQLSIIKGIATQGRREAHQYVSSYTLSYSLKGVRFRMYSVYGRIKLFRGNYNIYNTVLHKLTPAIKARFIRIHPRTWRSYIAMRVELYGCRARENFCNRPVGIQNGRIRNSAMSSSSRWNNYHAPWLARLHRARSGRLMGAWSSRHNNHNQFLQVDMGRSMKLSGINTQGRQDADQWVTAYFILYSSDGTHFSYVREWWDNVKTFRGNYDRNGIQTHSFDPPIYGRFVRLNPRGWKSHISMRLELYGCPWSKCDVPLGLEDGRIPNPMFRASSSYNYYCAARNARLHQRRAGRNGGAWCSRTRNNRQWLQVDFGTDTIVTRVCTQGRHNADQWVTSYYVSFSSRGQRFITYKEGRRTKIFAGNFDRFIVVKNRFLRPIKARYFRINPVTWRSWISMRVEFYGCIVGPQCNKPLGMQNGRIRAIQITASSSWDKNHSPNNGRLFFRRTGSRMGAWCARHNTRYQWLSVDFGRTMRVVKIATQGRQDYRQWVTQYYLSYSQDNVYFAEYEQNSARKYFTGNRDQNTVVQYRLFPRVIARYIRVHPWGWYKHISMRVEFYGCPEARCSVPIGFEDKRLPNGAMTASSYYNRYLAPWHGRINHRWSWSARRSTRTQWLQVYFGGLARITGISSQGRQDANQWVKTFVLTLSRDGIRFAKYPKTACQTLEVGRGNSRRAREGVNALRFLVRLKTFCPFPFKRLLR
ncbi:unnamed protein product [Porites evermanni]|uniref:F5/8 type C domain-containing protein n=1 Tax=Porites evermanni TaxID=104178 RepID=A0ABN8M430_9CNID|nr:unnamed protein product [Porites evermanni]